jgi:hypothetical protein
MTYEAAKELAKTRADACQGSQVIVKRGDDYAVMRDTSVYWSTTHYDGLVERVSGRTPY